MTTDMAAKVEPPSFSSLPDEIVENCLARASISDYRSLSLVSKSFYSLLSSRYIYALRSQLGNTEPCLYVCLQSLTYRDWFTLEQTLITKDGENKDELVLAPINIPSSSYNPPTPAKSTTVVVGSEIYHISIRSSAAVHVFDCRSHTWRRAPNMLVLRKHAKCVLLDGKMYVIGGRRNVDWGEVFDLKTQTWKLLPCPSDELHPEHQVLVFGGKLHVITQRNDIVFVYDPKEGEWTKTNKWWRLSLYSALSRPRCVIENLLFYDDCGWYQCYDLSSEKRVVVKGLEDLDMKRASDYCTLQLVNFGGKLVIIWHEGLKTTKHGRSKRICCAVIKLKKHESEIWGEIERSNVVVVSVPESCKRLSCLSVSL